MLVNLNSGLVFEVHDFCKSHCNNYRSTATTVIIIYDAYVSPLNKREIQNKLFPVGPNKKTDNWGIFLLTILVITST